MNDKGRLKQLLTAGHHCISMVTFEEDYAVGIVREAALDLGRSAYLWSCDVGVQDALLSGIPPIPQTIEPAAALCHFAELAGRPICITLDLSAHLKTERTLRVFRNLLRRLADLGLHLAMIDRSDDIQPVVASCATRFEISLPDAKELEELVRAALRRHHHETPVEVNITKRSWQTIIRNLQGLTRRQAEQIVAETVVDDHRLDAEDVNTVLAGKRRLLHGSGLLEYVECPVDIAEIGGLRRLKGWLAQRHRCLSEDALRFGLEPPRGVLMLGVQGAGKSLCAKAIATAWQQSLLRMDVGALYDRYVGESELRLRQSLQQAEMMAPVVLWIDEVEKAFASAAARSTDGGLSQRMFATLLTWMQEHRAPVFLVATANDIEALPPELLRKGRFDEIFFVDLPGLDVRSEIFAIHLRRRKRDPSQFDLARLAAASEGYSGAEIEQSIVAALHNAFSRNQALSTDHIVEAVQTSPPLSVTMAERIAELRLWARGRCVPAD